MLPLDQKLYILYVYVAEKYVSLTLAQFFFCQMIYIIYNVYQQEQEQEQPKKQKQQYKTKKHKH